MNWVELQGGRLLVAKNMMAEVTTTDKAMVAMVSLDIVDSDGDLIHQGKNKRGAGWDLARFNRAPVLTWQHDIGRPNIGAPEVQARVGARKGGEALFLDPLAFDSGDPFAMEISGKYQRGVLKETSVGFIGKVWDKLMDGERMTGREYFEQELIEVAAVNRGANPATTTTVKSMLARAGVVALVEDAGDSEVQGLKAELVYLREELRLLSNAVKSLGDFSGQGELDAVRQRASSQETAVKVMADTLLKRLQALGTAQ